MGSHEKGMLTAKMHSMLIIRECDVILKLVLRHQALKKYGIQLIAIEQNLIDLIWKTNLPRPAKKNLIVLDVIYSGKHIIENIAALWSYHRTMLTLKKVCSHNEIFRSAWGKPFFRTVTTVSKRLSRQEISPTHSYSTPITFVVRATMILMFSQKTSSEMKQDRHILL